jgi:HK97 gp10 family phage protein
MGVLTMATRAIDRLSKRLAAIPKAVRDAVQPALQTSGQELVDEMQHLAPVSKDGAHGNPPGAMRDSIVMTPGGQTTPPYSEPGGSQVVPDNAVAITAGNTHVRYAHLVEYGTTKMAAEPYFWPAYRLLKKRITSRTKRAIGKAVRENWARS